MGSRSEVGMLAWPAALILAWFAVGLRAAVIIGVGALALVLLGYVWPDHG